MKRPYQTWLFSGLTVIAVAAIGLILVLRSVDGGRQEMAQEIEITASFASDLRLAGFPITIERGFSASSHGGWHGDGTSVTAYKFPTREVPALREALEKKFPMYAWIESTSQLTAIASLQHLFPAELVPAPQAQLLHGRPAEGIPFDECFLDESKAILYLVSNTF